MDLESDFKELLELFNARSVEFLIVGAYALAQHGIPRYTGDLDILVRPSADNAVRVMEALKAFGFGEIGLARQDFEKAGNVIQLGVPPVRIDIVTSISGVSWEEADGERIEGRYGDIAVGFLGREQIIANKRASGRKRTSPDLEALGEE